MNPTPARERILALLLRIAPEADLSAIRGDAPLRTQIDFDSMDALNLFAALAEAFDISVPEDDYGRLQTLDDMLVYVGERHGTGAGRG